MADFDIDAYLNKKLGNPNPNKIDEIIRAKREKISDLNAYTASIAYSPNEALANQALEDGRTWGEFGKDVALSGIQGVDALAKLPALAYDKATSGVWYGPETQAISKMSDEREKLKSAFAQARNAQKAEITKEAGEAAKAYFGDGTAGITGQVAAELGTSFLEAAKDPASIPEFLAQQSAQLGVMGKVGRGAELAAQSAAKALPKLAATKAGQIALDKSAVAGAVGFGAGLHGVDVGSDTMARLMGLPEEVWEQNPNYLALASQVGTEEAKQTIASQLAEEATLKAAGVSLATAALPGGTAIERTLVGKKSGGFSAVPKAFTGEAIQEGIEEGTGKYFGNTSVKEVDAKQDLFEGVGAAAGQGAFYGGVLGGGIRGVQATAEAASNISFPKAEKAAAQKELVQAAIETGDVSALADPSKPSYAPEKAIAALFGNSQLPTATPEAKEANLVKANEIVATLEEKLSTAQEAYFMVSPEGIEQFKAQLVETQTALTQVNPANIPEVERLQATKTILEEQIADVTTAATKAAPRLKNQIDKIERQLAVSQEVLSTFTRESQAKDIDVDAQVAIINEPVKADAPAAVVARSATAAESVINLSMALPERLDAQVASELAENKSNALTEPQREYLRAFSAARLDEHSQKTTDDVAADIYTGTKNYTGIFKHRELIGGALVAGNKKLATSYLATLNNFMKDHQAKAEIAARSLEELQRTGKAVQFLKNQKTKEWFINRNAHLSFAKVAENGGMTIHKGTPVDQVTRIQPEAVAIAKAVKEMEAAYALKFATPLSKGSSNVQNSTQRKETQSNRESSSPSVNTREARKATTDQLPGAEGDSGKVVAETATVVDEENSVSSVTTGPTVKTEETKSQLQSTQDATTTLADHIAERQQYLLNPPEDYTPARAKAIVAWSENQLTRIAARLKTVEDADEVTRLEDMQDDLRNLVKDGKTMVESDAALEEALGPQGEVATEDLAETVEQPTEVVEKPTVTDPVDSGTLSIYADKSPENTAYQDRNLLADYTVQDLGKAGTTRPLVVIKNFLSHMNASMDKVLQFIGVNSLDELSEEQIGFLEFFKNKANEWQPIIQKGLGKVSDEKYRYTDVMQFLLLDGQETIDVEENIKTAISVAALAFVYEDAGFGTHNTDKDIKSLLGVPEETELGADTYVEFGQRMNHENVLRNSLGAKAREALGFKAKKTAEQDLIPRLDSALGAHVQKLLMERGLLVRHTKSAEVMASLRGVELQAAEEGQILADANFLGLAWDEQGNLPQEAQQIVDRSKGSKGILTKLFSVSSGLIEPSLEPIPFTQKTTDGTKEGIPSLLNKALAEKQSEARFISEDKSILLMKMGDEFVMGMAGARSSDPATTHLVNRKKHKAINDSLLREWNRYKDFVQNTIGETNLAQPIFLKYSVWKQQRVGIFTNVINPQMSKMHRYLIHASDWLSTIHIDNTEQMNNFQLRVLEGLGVKTDKQSNAVSLPVFKLVFNENVNDELTTEASRLRASKLNKAIDAIIHGSLNDLDLSAQQQQDIMEGVQAGKQKFQSFDALMAMARYRHALQNAREDVPVTFVTTIMGEVDGVNNGPMLSFLLYGAAGSVKEMYARLNKGGFFEIGHKHKDFNQWRGDKGNFDLYETIAGKIVDNIKRMIAKDRHLGPTFSAIEAFTKPLVENGEVTSEGRGIVKTPINAIHFGSHLFTSASNMAEAFMGEIYERITEAAKLAFVLQAQKAKEIQENLNTLLIQGDGPVLRTPLSIQQLMELDLSKDKRHKAAIKKAFMDTLGQASQQTLAIEFKTYLTQRDAFNKTAQLTFELHNAVYTALRKEFLDTQMDIFTSSGGKQGIPFGIRTDKKTREKVRFARHDLTIEHEAELREKTKGILPLIHTVMSKEDNQLGNGILMAKQDRQLSTKETYQNTVQFGNGLPGVAPVWSAKQKRFVQPKSVTTTAYENVAANPTVGVSSKLIHSLDSAISHKTQLGNQVLNNHDSLGMGLNTFLKVSRELNKNTWETVLNYSPILEMHDAYARQINNLSVMMKNGELSDDVMKSVAGVLTAFANKEKRPIKGLLEANLRSAHEMAYQADYMKLSTMAEMESLGQYAVEGGSYPVTDADRELALKKRSQLTKEVTPTTLENAKAIDKMVADFLKTGKQTPISEDAKQSLAEIQEHGDVLNIPNIQAMQLLEHGSTDTALPEAIRSQMDEVLSKMTTGALSLKEAVLEALNKIDAANMVQLLSQRYNAIPKDLWSNQGTPTIPSDPDLVAFLEATPDVDAQQVIRELYKKLSKAPESRTKAFNLKLLTLLSKTVNPALKLRYVTPATAEGQVLAKPATKARGWYVSKDMQEEIYVLSPDFIHSGLTAETLLHELTHSALARTVEGATGEAKELVAELEVLRTRAENYIKEQGFTQYNAATGNVQELIAWGMTNQGFQRDVLNNVQVETKTGSNTLVTGMKKFIDGIVALLFKGSSRTEQEQAVNGMTVLISNVSGLFYEAAQTKPPADIVLAQESVVDAIHNYSTLDIHQALGDGSIDPTFDTHLRGLLAGIVQKLHGPYGSFKESLMANQANSPMDVWMKALDTGVAPFASQVMAHLAVTQQEAFAIEQVEATVKAALDGNESLTKMAYKELSKLYSEAYKLLKPSDFNSQAEYDFIFKMTSDNGDRSDYLARFAALGLAHQGFNKLLQVATERDTRRIKDAGTFAERIQLIFERVLEFFQKKITHTFDGQQADEKLKALVEQLVDIEAKKRFTLSRRATETNFTAPVEEGVKATTEAIRKKIVEVAGSKFVRESASGYVRGAGAIARTIANDQVDQFLNGVSKLRDRHFKGVPGLAAGMINTLRGPLEQYQELLRMTKNHERERKAIISNRAALALTAFSENGENLSKEAKANISSVFMRTGAHNLIDSFTLAEIESLVSNRASLLKAISTFEGKLTGPLKSKYIEQSNVLGHYKATGLVSGLLMMNAHLIARMAGTKYEAKITQEQASKVEENIKVLSTLYALKYTAESDLFQAKEIIRTENQRSDGNGVEFVLALHKRLEQESLEKLFKGNPALMVHGFTPEIVNPNTDIKIANVMDGQALINQGYSKGAAVPQDAADPDQTTKHVYVLRDGGLAPWLTGVFSLSNMKAKGTKKHDGYVNPKTATGVANASMQAAITNQKLSSLSSNADPRRDLSQETESQMAPVYNEQGQIVNWRYLMQEQTKNDLLERDNAFERIMGVLAGSIYDKQTTQEQNKIAVQVLWEEFQTGYKDRPESYLRIGPKSTNPELRQIWHLLPDATKKDIRKIWGEDEMSVRSDSLDIMFGYRKLSLADMFKKDPAARNALEKLFVGFMEHNLKMHGKINKGLTDQEAENYAKRAAVIVTRGERAWMELMGEVKDIIVVKTGLVLLGNIYSNISLLWMNGVPWSDMVHHHLVALKGATAYQQDTAELAKFQTLLDTGYTQGNEAEIQRNIVRLKDALARNPVGKLIDAGLMPTIVEDLTADTDIYSYKSALARKTERFTNALPPSVKAAGRVIYMTHDTKMYQGLSRITQLSDFVARYTLYQHLTTKKDSPLSEKEAIQSASDAFVNYDIPLHRKMQFTDDLGVTMFTKYFMQIQRVLLRLSKDNPARVLLTIALGNLMSLGPIVLEGSALTRIGNNPFGLGALNYPDTLEDLATVSGAMALIK